MPIAKKKDIPQDFLVQMKSNLKKTSTAVLEEEPPEPVSTPTAAPAQAFERPINDNPSFTPLQHAHGPAKDKYADVMNIRLSKGRRNEIKAFCTNCGVTVTQYIESSFEFFAREVAAGNIVISKGGITKVTQ